jgi:importin subunit beta-1
LLGLCTDPVIQVKDTAVWTLGRICEFLLESILPHEFQSIIEALLIGLNDNPKIVQISAWSIQHVCRQLGTTDNSAVSSKLSQYFDPILTALINSAQKSPFINCRNANDITTRHNIFESITILIENSARDVHPIIQKLLNLSLQTLANSLNQVGGMEENKTHPLDQENFLEVFQTIVRYDPSLIRNDADAIMQTILRIIAGAPRNSIVKEVAFCAIGTFAQAAEFEFSRYMESVMPYLGEALANHEDYAVCSIALGVIGDLSRALNEGIFPYCESLINQIGILLDNPNLHRKLRPSCLYALGDLSLAISGRFEVYVHPAMNILGNISNQLGYIPQVKFCNEEYR